VGARAQDVRGCRSARRRGKGTILFSQLDVSRHVDRSKPGYDPVAERVLINVLQGTYSKEER